MPLIYNQSELGTADIDFPYKDFDETSLNNRGMSRAGQFEDLRYPGNNYVVVYNSFTGGGVSGGVRTLNQETLIKYDSEADYVRDVMYAPLAGSIAFYKETFYFNNPAQDAQSILNLIDMCLLEENQYWRDEYYIKNGIPVGKLCYNGGGYQIGCYHTGPIFDTTAQLFRVDVYKYPMILESVSSDRDRTKDATNGQVFVTVKKEWKTLNHDTDIDGDKLTPDTPPWMYRIENVKVGTEAIEEQVEKIYPDMSVNQAWRDMVYANFEELMTQNELREYRKALARKAYKDAKDQADKIYEDAIKVAETISGSKGVQMRSEANITRKSSYQIALTTYKMAIEQADDAFDIKKARKDPASSGVVFNKDGLIENDTAYMTVPFVNSAGVRMEGSTNRYLTRLDFSYNARSFDFDAPRKYKNKVNDREILIAGMKFPERTVQLSDIGAEYKRDFNPDGTYKWKEKYGIEGYWTINISLLVDEKTFNREYANIGRHVREKIRYAIYKKGNEYKNEMPDNKKIYRVGSGPHKGMIINAEEMAKIHTFSASTGKSLDVILGGPAPEIDYLPKNPVLTDNAPRLDSMCTDNARKKRMGESGALLYELEKHTEGEFVDDPESIEYEENGGFSLLEEDDLEYEIVTRNELQRIFHADGHYYTKYMLDIQRPAHEPEEITEPMFLSQDGTKLSPFMSDGRQKPVYNKGCKYEPIDFSVLGIPEVA